MRRHAGMGLTGNQHGCARPPPLVALVLVLLAREGPRPAERTLAEDRP